MTRITSTLATDHTPHKRRQTFAYIDTCSAKPRIKGRRITVANVAVWHLWQGDTVQRIAEDYQLTLPQIYSALAYYYDHQAIIDRQIETERVRYEAAAATPTRLEQKLRAGHATQSSSCRSWRR